jgi:hypothetical protein
MNLAPGRRVVKAVAVALLLGIAPAASAQAATDPPTCVSIPGLPSWQVDIDGDGNPDAVTPGGPQATLCLGADVYLAEPFTAEPCGPGFPPSCMKLVVTVGFTATADTAVSLCYGLDGPPCTQVDPAPVSADLEPRSICFGWSLNGIPCP